MQGFGLSRATVQRNVAICDSGLNGDRLVSPSGQQKGFYNSANHATSHRHAYMGASVDSNPEEYRLKCAFFKSKSYVFFSYSWWLI